MCHVPFSSMEHHFWPIPLVATSESDDPTANNIQGLVHSCSFQIQQTKHVVVDSLIPKCENELYGIVPSTLTLTLIPLVFLVRFLVPWTGCLLAVFFSKG